MGRSRKGATRVLVVEDNATTRTLLKETLALEGFEVTSAPDGRKALTEIKKSRPDVVVLDVMMPGMDGFDVLDKLREDSTTRELPVLLLTALDDNESTWRGWSSGCHYYMTKPFEVEDLLSAVRRLADGQAA